MGRFDAVSRSNILSYRGSSYRGNARPTRTIRGNHSTFHGRIESRHEKNTRGHTRSHVIERTNYESGRYPIHDARDVLRQNHREKLENTLSRSNENRLDRREQVSERIRSSRDSITKRIRGSSRGSRHTDDRNGFSTDRKDRSINRHRSRSRDYENNRRNEPLVIVTGLDNTRSFKKENSSNKSRSQDHYVTSKGKNTLVTLNNDKYKSSSSSENNQKRRNSRSNEESIETNKIKNYEPIKIKITNSNYIPLKLDEETKNSSQNNNGIMYDDQQQSDDSMDYKDDNNDHEEKYNSISNQSQNNMRLNAQLLNNISALLPNPSSVTNTLSSMSNFNSTFKPPGMVVNNFPTGGMYSSGFDRIWNTSTTNFLNHTKNNVSTQQPVSVSSNSQLSKEGYKLLVSNLHPKVSEDDVLELFSDIGPIKRARFVDKGLAEVVYVRIEHAKEAIQKYDLKELDGRQMVIGFADKSLLSSSETNSQSAEKSDVTSRPSSILNSANGAQMYPCNNSHLNQTRTINQNINLAHNNNEQKFGQNSSLSSAFYEASNTLSQTPTKTLSNRFKSADQTHIDLPESKHTDKTQSIDYVDNSIIHQVLFNRKAAANINPVTFTVKL